MDMAVIVLVFIFLCFKTYIECNSCFQSYSKPMTRLSDITHDVDITKATILLQTNECFIDYTITNLHECLARCNHSPDCVAFAQRKQQCFICGDTVPQGDVSGMADSSLWKHIYVSQEAMSHIRNCHIEAIGIGRDDTPWQRPYLRLNDTQVQGQRGLTVARFLPHFCSIENSQSFDTHEYGGASGFINHVLGLASGTFFVVLAGDEFTAHLTEEAKDLLGELGIPDSHYFEYRSSLALINMIQEDGRFCWLTSDYHARYDGPSRVEIESLDLVEPICLNGYV